MAKILAIGSRCEVCEKDDEVCIVDIREGVGNIVGDVHNLYMFADDEFDRIEFHHVLEHIWPNEVVDVLKELKRVLKAGGVLELSVPDMIACAKTLLMGNRQILNNIFGTFEEPEYTSHKFGYTADTLEPILKSVFSNVRNVPRKDEHEMRYECIK